MTADDLVRRRARHLAAQAAASGDPVGWFETLYDEDPPKLRWRAEFTRR